jgi:hypothetical protein
MKLISFIIDTHKESDSLINGIKFSLKVSDSIKIVNFFKNQNKWNEYYFYEIGIYDLTLEQLNSILELKSNYWFDNKILYDFSGFTIELNNNHFHSDEILIIQSYDKCFYKKCHFYQAFGEDEVLIYEQKLLNINTLKYEDLKILENPFRVFDYKNYFYRIEKILVNEIYFKDHDLDAIKLDRSNDYNFNDHQ